MLLNSIPDSEGGISLKVFLWMVEQEKRKGISIIR
jgi:hypothetical protein